MGINEIINAVSIPVMAKARIGHMVEAQILEHLGVDCVDESEGLTVADEDNHINKNKFKVPFVCGCRNLAEALRRVAEGASMIRTKGEAGTGNVVEAVRHIRTLHKEIRALCRMDDDEVFTLAKVLGKVTTWPMSLVRSVPRWRRRQKDQLKLLMALGRTCASQLTEYFLFARLMLRTSRVQG